MKRQTLITAAVLGAAFVLILIFVARYALQGPTFSAEAWPSYEECVRNIPAEWQPGSVERDGAAAACGYVHGRR